MTPEEHYAAVKAIVSAERAERERCAKIVEDAASKWQDSSSEWMVLNDLAAAIRTQE